MIQVPAHSAFATTVTIGFTPKPVGMKLVSTTKTLGTSCIWQFRFRTDFVRSSPIRHVPSGGRTSIIRRSRARTRRPQRCECSGTDRLLLHMHCIERGTKRRCQLLRIVVRPEVHEEQPGR